MNQPSSTRASTAAPYTGRPFGWAGWLTRIPDSWRLHRVEGNTRRGRVDLGDEFAVLFRITWATVTRRGADVERIARRHLRRALPRDRRSDELQLVRNESLDPLVHHADKRQELDRYVGYAPATGRIFDIAYHRVSRKWDRFVRNQTIGRFTEQPDDQPRRWAFFAVAFVVPDRFNHESATLNLGDMRVRFIRRAAWTARESLAVRHIYPAELALARGDLEYWMQQILTELRPLYRPRGTGWLRRRTPQTHRIDSPVGVARVVELGLRTVLTPLAWRFARRMQLMLVHDEEHDQLIALQLAARPERIEQVLGQVVAELHWADHAR